MDRSDIDRVTKIAVLGTLAEFHQNPLPYNLAALVDLVAAIHPDLLCLDITHEQWQQKRFDKLSPEYGQALLPLAAQTDIVVVPIGGQQMMPRANASGWRGETIKKLRRLLEIIQAGAPGPEAINQGWRHDLGNVLYGLTRQLAGKTVEQAHRKHIEALIQATLAAAANNPGNRILVVTNIQYCHYIRPQLQKQLNLQTVTYADL